MLAAQRHDKIVEAVQRHGAVRVVDFAHEFGVSGMTIRRDLDILAERGLLAKVHGGATRPATSTEEPGFDAKSVRQREEKDAIGRAGAQLIAPGMAVGLSAGTTTWALAHHLQAIDDLTVVTNSIRIADVLHTHPASGQTVVLTGGVRTPSDALVGPIAVSALAQLHLDIVFLGVHGMSADTGFTTPNLLEADANRALIAAGHRLVVLADHTKWGTVGISTIAQLADAHALITDHQLPAEARRALTEHIDDIREVGPATQ